MPNLKFCTPTKEELPLLLPFLKKLFTIEKDFEFSEDRQLKGLEMLFYSKTAYIVIAKVNNQIAAMGTGQLVISTSEGGLSVLIEDIVVKSDFQRQGIGRNIINTIRQWGVKNGATRMQLLADIYNTEAHLFYEKCGWEKTNLFNLKFSFSRASD